jgi:serine/threonine protein kinase
MVIILFSFSHIFVIYIHVGLDYLHKGCELPIVHRDVKSSNILLGQNLRAKIADFGLSKAYISDSQTHISATAAGTTGYMDPQYVVFSLSIYAIIKIFVTWLIYAMASSFPCVCSVFHKCSCCCS